MLWFAHEAEPQSLCNAHSIVLPTCASPIFTPNRGVLSTRSIQKPMHSELLAGSLVLPCCSKNHIAVTYISDCKKFCFQVSLSKVTKLLKTVRNTKTMTRHFLRECHYITNVTIPVKIKYSKMYLKLIYLMPHILQIHLHLYVLNMYLCF